MRTRESALLAGGVLRAVLSDRRELSAGQLREDAEAERIQELALLHQPVQNRLAEVS